MKLKTKPEDRPKFPGLDPTHAEEIAAYNGEYETLMETEDNEELVLTVNNN